ncbi:MAG: VOC family protein [Methylococcales bacterium]
MHKNDFLIHHVSVIVKNVAESLKFYADVLGLQQIERPNLGFPGAWLAVGSSQQLHLLELDNPDPTTGRPQHGGRDRHVALTVPDISAIKQTLDNAGVFYTLSISGRKALFCRDPDGNAVEIIERSA